MKNTAISPFDMVRQFHAKVGQIDAAAPNISANRELRIALITEEFREMRESLEANDIVGVAHELADLLYVVIGSALQWGIPIERVLHEVHRSNMTKDGGAKRADGKILKGPNYSPPNIAGVLAGYVPPCASSAGLRFYIRVPGWRFWCVPIRAVEGQSIETYCNGRSPQRESVEVATDPSIWERCTACELAADDADRREAGRLTGRGAADVSSAWRPIDSAPQNGVRVLIFDGECVTTAYWNAGGGEWRGHDRAYEASHWMPLPSSNSVQRCIDGSS